MKTRSVLVVGAGPVGMLAALIMARSGWQVTLVERQTMSPLSDVFDDRQLALTYASVAWINRCGLLPELEQHLVPITRIHTSSQGMLGQVMMRHDELSVPALGYTLSQRQLGLLLRQALNDCPELTLLDQFHAQTLTQQAGQVELQGERLAQSHQLQADLLLASDGAHSWVRRTLGIGEHSNEYDHHLLTAAGTLSDPHQGLAVERFTPQGPTALLPRDHDRGVKVVYCYSRDDMPDLNDTQQLLGRINHQLGRQLGRVVHVEQVRHYPLLRIRADQLLMGRCLLLGNAAHTQHPVAGQGLNLGIRDVQALANWARESDINQLPALASERQQDHASTMQFTHLLASGYARQDLPSRLLGAAAITLVSTCRPLKQRLARLAMGY